MKTEECRPDRLGLGRLLIYQDEMVFKFTVDPILAAAFLRARREEYILDMGTGSGVIPLWLAGYRDYHNVTGLELQPEVADLARANVRLNALEERIKIVMGDIRNLPAELRGLQFPWIVSNPPYWSAETRHLTGNPVLDRAKFELTCTIEDVVKAARRLAKGNGRLIMVHLPERLPDILGAFRQYGFEPKRLLMVHAKPAEPPNRIVIEGQQGGKPHLNVLAPLYIRDGHGEFTSEMMRIYEGK
ncbi:MAG TPA: methyltransferase [Bacillota bacterium]|nr:methyltransferase [Bacillota bacterium]